MKHQNMIRLNKKLLLTSIINNETIDDFARYIFHNKGFFFPMGLFSLQKQQWKTKHTFIIHSKSFH